LTRDGQGFNPLWAEFPVYACSFLQLPMHHTSLSKIESASSFLLWFRSELAQDVQHQLRPYLAQPYQSALKVLDSCSTTHSMDGERSLSLRKIWLI
jgi:hypothetical protein